MRRREFMTLIGGAAASVPLAARAQQPTMPVIGFLSSRASGDAPHLLAAVRQGLKEAGFIEGQTLAIEYRFAANQNDRLPALAADLVRLQVAAIIAVTGAAALAAKAATTTIPIVFEVGGDPIALGLVPSLNRPGGNATGVTNMASGIAPKLLELLHESLPAATDVAFLLNPTSPRAAALSQDMQMAARTFGLRLHVLHAKTESDLDSVFATLVHLRAGGVVISPDPLFTARSERLAALSVRYGIPAVYESREFAIAGGLMSYGASLTEAYRQAGAYTGRILRGDRPADLPVQQATKVELFINLKTAKALGISFPLPLLGRADEVIE
jgi:putative ABC transport system substrate-binding protein